MRAARPPALAALVVAALIATSAPAQPAASRLTVCVVSLNDPEEIAAFRSSLDPAQFELVDIRGATTSPYAPHVGLPGADGGSWLLAACRPSLRCDVMVYSAEFAGDFFGKSGISLSLQEMEEAACQPRCAGLFRTPREVFLLGCNTLATKAQDTRTPEQYLRVLLEHDFDRAAAERVVELRYGPLGPSFRESIRRIFAGVPRIYGFASVAPRAQYTAPMLARYLHAVPDYAAALREQANDGTPNRALLTAFRDTSLVQTTGLMPNEPGAGDRKQMCALYDESRPIADRVRIAYGMLARPDALRFVPTVEVFLSRHPPARYTSLARSTLAEMQYLEDARDDVLGIIARLDASALELELAHFAALLGWISGGDLRALTVATTRELLSERLTAETVDVLCAIAADEPLHRDFGAEDFPPAIYADPQALRLIACVAPSDRRVCPPVAGQLRSADPVARVWAAYALTQLRPTDEGVLLSVVPYVRDPSPAVADRIRWLLRVSNPLPETVLRAIGRIDPTLLRERAAAAERPR